MIRALDLQADALLLTLVQQAGGDLRAAFAILCTKVSPEDLAGETFEQALARAVETCFSRPSLVPPGRATPCEPRDA